MLLDLSFPSKVLRLLFFVVVVAVVAGCGSTVVKTKVVHSDPCSTVERMHRCILDMAQLTVQQAGDDPDFVRVSCIRAAKPRVWVCTMRVPDGYHDSACVRTTIRLTDPSGVPWIVGGGQVKQANCDKLWPRT